MVEKKGRRRKKEEVDVPTFTARAEEILEYAAAVAHEQGYQQVHGIHILHGILADASGTAYTIITDHGITPDTLQGVTTIDNPQEQTMIGKSFFC